MYGAYASGIVNISKARRFFFVVASARSRPWTEVATDLRHVGVEWAGYVRDTVRFVAAIFDEFADFDLALAEGLDDAFLKGDCAVDATSDTIVGCHASNTRPLWRAEPMRTTNGRRACPVVDALDTQAVHGGREAHLIVFAHVVRQQADSHRVERRRVPNICARGVAKHLSDELAHPPFFSRYATIFFFALAGQLPRVRMLLVPIGVAKTAVQQLAQVDYDVATRVSHAAAQIVPWALDHDQFWLANATMQTLQGFDDLGSALIACVVWLVVHVR